MAEVALLVMSVAAGVGQITSGIAANRAAQDRAEQQRQQATLAQSEADREAGRKGVERRRFLAEQRMAYLASGVTLVGTPGIVQEKTFKEFQLEIDALKRSGAAKAVFGRREAAITSRTGRAQLTSSIFSGAGTIGTGFYLAGKN